MSHKLKILSALALLSVSSFASEEGPRAFCPDQLDPHLDSYYQQGNRIEEAVFNHDPILLDDGGTWGTLLRLGAADDLGIKKIIGLYECSLHEDKTTATIRHYFDKETDPEAHDIEICFLENKIMEVYKLIQEEALDENGKPVIRKELVPDSPLIGNPAPIVAHFPLSKLIGVPYDMKGELTPEGSVIATFQSVFEQTHDIQSRLEAIKKQITDQETVLTKGISDQLTADFLQFNADFDVKLNAFEGRINDLFTATNGNIDGKFSTLDEELKEHFRITQELSAASFATLNERLTEDASTLANDLANKTNEQNNLLGETIRKLKVDLTGSLETIDKANIAELTKSMETYSNANTAAVVNQANEIIKKSQFFLNNDFKETVQGLFEKLTGVKFGETDLVGQLKSPIQNTEEFLRNLDSLTYVMGEYHAHPGFYAGSIESLIYGISPDKNTGNYEVWSIQKYIKSSINLVEDLGLPQYLEHLQTMLECFKQTQDFIQNHDLQKEYRILGYLKKMFGEIIPVSSPSSKPLYNYCQTTHFSQEDYGIYGWIRDVHSTLGDYHKLKKSSTGPTRFEFSEFNEKIKNLFDGKIEEVKGSTRKQIFVIPETFFNGLRNYPQIIQAFNTILVDAKNRSFEDQLARMDEDLNRQFEALYTDMKTDMVTIHKNTKKWAGKSIEKSEAIHQELRYMIFRLTQVDIDNPDEREDMTRKLRLLDLKKNHSLTMDQYEELMGHNHHPHHSHHHRSKSIATTPTNE